MQNGKRSAVKMTWQEFQEWQSWDEFPEVANNPPLTVDVMFFYENTVYYIESGYNQYHIFKYYFYDRDWREIYSNNNFLELLTTPIDLFHGKSFRTVINELDFDM